MNHRYTFSVTDHFLTITADSLTEAQDRLREFLKKGTEEFYTFDDYILVEEEPNYV